MGAAEMVEGEAGEAEPLACLANSLLKLRGVLKVPGSRKIKAPSGARRIVAGPFSVSPLPVHPPSGGT